MSETKLFRGKKAKEEAEAFRTQKIKEGRGNVWMTKESCKQGSIYNGYLVGWE